MNEAKFTIGQVVYHQLFNYRGVIIDVDYKFLGSEEWYQHVARSQPPKDQPWYHVLVNDTAHQTYVAERNLKSTEQSDQIHHPLLNHYFNGKEGAYYQLRIPKN